MPSIASNSATAANAASVLVVTFVLSELPVDADRLQAPGLRA